MSTSSERGFTPDSARSMKADSQRPSSRGSVNGRSRRSTPDRPASPGWDLSIEDANDSREQGEADQGNAWDIYNDADAGQDDTHGIPGGEFLGTYSLTHRLFHTHSAQVHTGLVLSYAVISFVLQGISYRSSMCVCTYTAVCVCVRVCECV